MPKQRFLSLDVMRGLTLALMILVNTPGSWSAVYAPLLHAQWHGATPTDYIFPFFLFIVGSALFFSSRSRTDASVAARLLNIVRRSALIFLIGVLLNAFPFTGSFAELRIPGVLQRIALAYLLAAPIALFIPGLWRAVIMAGLLLGYWALLQLGQEPYGVAGNVVRQLDLWVFGPEHIWQGKGLAFDPEGLLSTLPSVVTALLGFETTRVLCTVAPRRRALVQLSVAGAVLVGVALLWHPWFPVNKYLWTSSFVLLTGGAAILCLVALVLLESVAGVQPLYRACAMLGKNPLFIYVLSILWAKTLSLVPLGDTSAYQWSYAFLADFLSAKNASLLFALITVALMWLVAWWLDRKRIVISI
ncbi:acyltransferase family protein [Marinimicrobium agarilyticum]|uniref:acyltransferase family protein n=1 Tax=Marinimicrobium agarilyticum TaxID=306546 RepID=UPI0004182F09|nr:heparan-alpha-glucosaminide N-acetyltransferase domain-containing protein [Marinimicrobium agarilyticum]